MNASVETVTITCPGGGTITLTKHQDQDVSFVDAGGTRQGNATEAMIKLFATIKANGSGTAPVIGRVDH
ncbi:hypothetical protein CU669_09255 [Paramagnetospirillum kuznetsovii]|uniref:Uncharacterized protein n=1 Tax=Paramagnetospirillum kuznetsovii TaxID=2053833 RepID=A0A364NZ62_9PROT|nr:hypothetical protein [Paramagnetospirillum kuznetsovii]RAU22300.1 hypothetical protein CU669_09255 [Paramagnetospirillum kuznetsovii]